MFTLRCACIHLMSFPYSPEERIGSWKLELLEAVCCLAWVLGTWLGSPVRTVSALIYWVDSSAPPYSVLSIFITTSCLSRSHILSLVCWVQEIAPSVAIDSCKEPLNQDMRVTSRLIKTVNFIRLNPWPNLKLLGIILTKNIIHRLENSNSYHLE